MQKHHINNRNCIYEQWTCEYTELIMTFDLELAYFEIQYAFLPKTNESYFSEFLLTFSTLNRSIYVTQIIVIHFFIIMWSKSNFQLNIININNIKLPKITSREIERRRIPYFNWVHSCWLPFGRPQMYKNKPLSTIECWACKICSIYNNEIKLKELPLHRSYHRWFLIIWWINECNMPFDHC